MQSIHTVEAAMRFFTMTGDFRFDDLHPSDNERAARIAARAAVPRPLTPPY